MELAQLYVGFIFVKKSLLIKIKSLLNTFFKNLNILIFKNKKSKVCKEKRKSYKSCKM